MIEKVNKANSLIKKIGSVDRHFFRNEDGLSSYFFISKKDRLWFYDSRSEKKFCVHYKELYSRALNNFSHGGTLKDFISHLVRFIILDNHKIQYGVTGIEDKHYWDYTPENAREVTKTAMALGIMREPEIEIKCSLIGQDRTYNFYSMLLDVADLFPESVTDEEIEDHCLTGFNIAMANALGVDMKDIVFSEPFFNEMFNEVFMKTRIDRFVSEKIVERYIPLEKRKELVENNTIDTSSVIDEEEKRLLREFSANTIHATTVREGFFPFFTLEEFGVHTYLFDDRILFSIMQDIMSWKISGNFWLDAMGEAVVSLQKDGKEQI